MVCRDGLLQSWGRAMDMTSSTGMLLDGVFASEAIDTSGEILDIKGCDISTLAEEGVANFEHRGGGDEAGHSALDIVGKIIYARKVFGPEDCENDRQLQFWKELELPFIYGVVRLFDGAGHESAKAIAAAVRDHVANNEKLLVRWSIEGSTMKQEGKRLLESVARRVAITWKPANRSANSGLLYDPNAPEGFDKNPGEVKKDFLDKIIEEQKTEKSEHPHPLYTKLGGSREIECNPVLDEMPLDKTLSAGSYNAAPSTLTGGAALQVEHRVRGWANQAKAALRDYKDEHGSFKAFLKNRLPEASDEFIDHFADIVETHRFKKSDLLKAEQKPKFRYAGDCTHLDGDLINDMKRSGKAMFEEDFHEQAHPEDLARVNAGFSVPILQDPHVAYFSGTLPSGKPAIWFAHSNIEHVFTPDGQVDDPVEKTELDLEAATAMIRKFERLDIELRKAMGPGVTKRKKTVEPPMPTEVEFQGKKVKPGEGVLNDGGQHDGTYAILHHDHEKYIGVLKDKLGSHAPDDLRVFPRGKTNLVVQKDPEFIDEKPIVDAQQHGHLLYNATPEQADLIHGLDLTGHIVDLGAQRAPGTTYAATRSFWAKSPKGGRVFVKAAEKYENEFNEARREVAYHNLVKDFFGLGEHMPSVALMRHPKTGREHAVIKKVKFGEHIKMQHGVPVDPDQEAAMVRLGKAGKLDSLTLMNVILGNNDRHDLNYMLTPDEPHLHLIDHGLAFSYTDLETPHYIGFRPNGPHGPMHADAARWLHGLDPEKLRQHMLANGTGQHLAAHGAARLRKIQAAHQADPDAGLETLLLAAAPKLNGLP